MPGASTKERRCNKFKTPIFQIRESEVRELKRGRKAKPENRRNDKPAAFWNRKFELRAWGLRFGSMSVTAAAVAAGAFGKVIGAGNAAKLDGFGDVALNGVLQIVHFFLGIEEA